jgi:hypothetical protein
MKTGKRKTLVGCSRGNSPVVKRTKTSEATAKINLPVDDRSSESSDASETEDDIQTAVSTDPHEEEDQPLTTIDPKLISGVVSGVLEGVYSCIRSLPPRPLAPADEGFVLPPKLCEKKMTLILDLDETL